MSTLSVDSCSLEKGHRVPGKDRWMTAGIIAGGIVATVITALLSGSSFGQVTLIGAVAVVMGLCALRSPTIAVIVLIVAMFLRVPLASEIELPVEPWLFVFAGVVVATVVWMHRTPDRLRGVGAVECAMVLYLLWNFYSMITPHKYAAIDPLRGDPLPVPQFIVIAVLIPFASYVVGRYTFDHSAAVRALLWTMLAASAFSAAVSIMPFLGMGEWVWPRYIVTDPAWDGRAVGIFNQPVVNGMVLVLGFVIATVMASRRSEPTWRRIVAVVVIASCGIGIYLTYTRVVWLSAVVVLLLGALLARGSRGAFIASIGVVMTLVALNWSRFTSSDRSAGGVASESEIYSRLNDIQTALWARAEEPLQGWGIGRFPVVNTHHHQQWSQEVPWSSGYGDPSHSNELGLLAELGVIGLALWLCVLALIAFRLWEAYRILPDHQLCGRPLAVIAIMAMAIMVCSGLTVDLRYFDFPTVTTFLIVGVAVGWSDRYRRAHADSLTGGVEREPWRHV